LAASDRATLENEEMSKKILLIAGVLLAAGSVAAISAPHFRGGGHMRHGPQGFVFGERGDLFGPTPVRFGERLKELDANKDGAIALDEFLARRDPTFSRLDKNNDGIVDRAEFEAAARESADYWVKRFIKRFDTDGDGKVGKDEFAKARKDRFAMRDLDGDGRIGIEDMPPGPRERMRRWRGERDTDARDGKEPGKDGKEGGRPFSLDRLLGRVDRQFNRLDKNGDGFIDAKDLEPAAAERIAFASKRFFRRFDADSDGKVTKDEFNRLAKQRFSSLDLDGDGKITEADLPPMMRGRGFLK
jgi:Ca2+-binding EF-hand superfamily protein